jgi:hypothetical protein
MRAMVLVVLRKEEILAWDSFVQSLQGTGKALSVRTLLHGEEVWLQTSVSAGVGELIIDVLEL